MDVSVIIVNYKTKELTTNCIKSVYASKTGYSFEIILVDNASSDGSVEAIRSHFPDVRIIESKENVGFARANNMAAKIAVGRYLYILNSDTEIENDVIEKLVAYGDLNEDAGIIGTKVVFPSGELQENYYKFPSLLSELVFFLIGIIKMKDWSIFHLNKYERYLLNEPREVDVIAGCSLIVKRKVYEQIGLFNEKFFMYYEDGEFCYRVKKSGYKSIYLPTVLVTHIHMGTSKGNARNFKLLASCFKSACIYFRCIKNSFYALLFKVICFVAWFIELILLRLLFVITKKEKIKSKINMLKALLTG
jgi:GT2 family glycosyltransferase